MQKYTKGNLINIEQMVYPEKVIRKQCEQTCDKKKRYSRHVGYGINSRKSEPTVEHLYMYLAGIISYETAKKVSKYVKK